MQSVTRLATPRDARFDGGRDPTLDLGLEPGESREDLGVVVDGYRRRLRGLPAQQPRDRVTERVRRERHCADRQRRQSDRGGRDDSTGSGNGPDGQRGQHPTRAHDLWRVQVLESRSSGPGVVESLLRASAARTRLKYVCAPSISVFNAVTVCAIESSACTLNASIASIDW